MLFHEPPSLGVIIMISAAAVLIELALAAALGIAREKAAIARQAEDKAAATSIERRGND